MTSFTDPFAQSSAEDGGENEEKASLIENLIQIIAAESDDAISCNWLVGERLRKEISFLKDAAMAQKIINQVSKRLNLRFKTEIYSLDFLRLCLRFADTFPDMSQTVELSEFLTWEHLLELISLEDDLHRVYYTEQCRQKKFSVAQLTQAITENSFAKDFPELEEDNA